MEKLSDAHRHFQLFINLKLNYLSPLAMLNKMNLKTGQEMFCAHRQHAGSVPKTTWSGLRPDTPVPCQG
ncbi:hypothetical protein [Lelliottia wanjuensis]|uniref:hypothetical protein n=1 Tax=Lelliottia wanjuensis TaxID=3050585 RepID=UPI00254E0AAE|nr:hypothetical protein [Lelliottia sp. V104_15]MDK9605847.1 hypothetical protein [Lelliottia sp. V104_15]